MRIYNSIALMLAAIPYLKIDKSNARLCQHAHKDGNLSFPYHVLATDCSIQNGVRSIPQSRWPAVITATLQSAVVVNRIHAGKSPFPTRILIRACASISVFFIPNTTCMCLLNTPHNSSSRHKAVGFHSHYQVEQYCDTVPDGVDLLIRPRRSDVHN